MFCFCSHGRCLRWNVEIPQYAAGLPISTTYLYRHVSSKIYLRGSIRRTSTKAVPWGRRLSVSFLPRLCGFNPRPVRAVFVLDVVVMGQVSNHVLRISPVSTILPLLHDHSCVCNRRNIRVFTASLNSPLKMTYVIV